MFLQIDNYLTPAEVQEIAELARQAKFIEGRRSNPHNHTKDNVIGDPSDPTAQKASQIALTALQRNEQSRNFAFPQRMAVPSLARYDVGMKYGAHIDAAFLPLGPQPLRSDVSCTMFMPIPRTTRAANSSFIWARKSSTSKATPVPLFSIPQPTYIRWSR